MVHFKFDSENVFCLKMSHLAKSYKKKVVFTNSRNFKIFFRQIKISCCLQNISKFHIGQINHAWLRAFWKKKFQKFQKSGKKNFPHKIPQGPPQAGPLCLGVFPSCHNTFHQIWSNSSFLPFPPLLYRLSEFTLNFQIGNSSAFNPQINFWHVSEFWRTREWKFLARLDTVSRSRKRSKTDFFREIFIESNFLALGLRALRIVHSKCSTSVKTSCGRA